MEWSICYKHVIGLKEDPKLNTYYTYEY